MGKRKRRADHNKTPPPPDVNMQSSQISLLSEKKCSYRVDSSTAKPSSVMDSIDASANISQRDQSPVLPRHSCSRAMFLKHHRHYYGLHYSRRSPCSHAEASTSHRKGTSQQDEKLQFKLPRKHNSELEHSVFSESGNRAFCQPEKSSLAKNAASLDTTRMVCGICEKLLRKKLRVLDNASSSDLSAVVAVLVCGHAYHADCLEQRTCHEDRQDPPCPLCAGLLSEAEASAVQDQ